MNRKAIALTLFTLNLAIGAARADQVQDNSQTNTSSGDRTAASPVRAGQDTEVRNLQPFTHFTWIPADSDKGTIRFETAKMVQVPTRITYTMNYCQELAFRDPGGSMYCPYAQTESPAPAYEVTYSYIGRPLASDEYGGRNITFYVYFRPDELAPDVRQALTAKKRDRADLAEYFTVNAFREPVRRIVIDEAQSRFCDGNFVDGMWTHSDANCKDEIHTKAIAGLTDYITVRVDPVSARAGHISAGAVARSSSGDEPAHRRELR